MTKLCVKKPYTVLVIIVLVLVLGVVSFFDMNTDLLPSMNLPYLVVTTTYPGASPEKVESAVTAPLESALGTVNGVENVTSTSAENYSMVMLEFEAETNMDSAMVKVSTAIDQISGMLPELAGTPMIMEISPNMMATMYLSVSYDGMDIYDLSEFAEEKVVPYLERQNGVASVSDVGLVEKQVEVRLNQTKIDDVNDRMLMKVSDSLADAKKELDKAYQDLLKGQQELADGKQELLDNEAKLDDALEELKNTDVYAALSGMNQLLDGMEQLRAGLAEAKAGRQQIVDALAAMGKTPADLPDLIAEAEQGIPKLEEAIAGLRAMADAVDMDPVEMLPEDTKQSYQELLQVLKDAGMDTSGLEGADDLSGLSSGLKAMVGIIGMMTDDMDPNDPLLPVLQQAADSAAGLAESVDPPISSVPEFETAYNALIAGMRENGMDVTELENAKTIGQAVTALNNTADALDAQLAELKAGLEGLKQMQEGYAQLETTIPQLEATLQELINTYDKALEGMGMKKSGLKAASLTASDIDQARMQISAALGSADAQLSYGKSQLESALAQIEAGKTQLEDGQTQIDDGFKQIEDAYDSYEKARAEALENANLDALLNMQTLAGMITAQNFEMPAGYIKDGEEQWLLRVGEGFASVQELEGILLCSIPDIGDVRLGDVADITIIDNAGESYARVNGQDAVVLSIFKGSTASTSEVSKTCDEAIAELQEKYPGLYILPLMDQGDYIQLIVDSVLSNLMWGAVLAVIVLAIFLKDVKPTLVVAFSIPFSLMVAIVLMYFSDVTLNMISLSGLALGVGMLVDNSVVVIENIYRLRARGIAPARAAVQGTKQVAGAIAASTLTTICVFLPLVFTDGMTLDLLLDMALTIGYSLMASLIVALTVVPSMSVTVLKKTTNKAHPWFDAMLRAYDRSVRVCLKHKVLPILLAVGLLVVSAFGATRMGMVLLPEIGGNQLSVTVVLPEETERDEGYAAADAVMNAILTVPGVETVGAMSSGSMGGMLGGLGAGTAADYSNYMFYLMLDEDGSSRTDEVSAEIKAKTADIPNAEVLVSDGGAMDLSALTSTGLQVNLYGDDLDELLATSEDVMQLLDQVEGLGEISNGQEDGDPLIHLVIDRDAAMRQGLTVAQIYQELAAELTTETTSTTVTIDREEMNVIVVVDEEDALALDGLMDFDFKVSKTDEEDGSTYTEHHKLSEFAQRREGKSVAAVNRENQSRTMTVTAVTEAGYNTTLLAREVQTLLDDYQAPDGIDVSIGGESTDVLDMMFEMVKMIALAILFIYMIMVVQFQNLVSPFIVLFTIPLAFTGGLLALMVTGRPLSITGMMGFLMLAGVIVNNGIVFVDYANQLWIAGMPKTEALVATGRTRMRPILMTTMTTVLSMSVMLFKDDAGSAMGKDMSLVIIAGLMYATLMTLYIVPVLYDIVYRKPPYSVDVGEDDADELLDDAAEFMQQLEAEKAAQAAADAQDDGDDGDDPVGTVYLQ